MLDKDLEKFDLACTYLKNDQNISAHNLFISLAQDAMKKENFKAGVYLILASECKARQGKDNKEELGMAAKYYLKIAKKDNFQLVLCIPMCSKMLSQVRPGRHGNESVRRGKKTRTNNC